MCFQAEWECVAKGLLLADIWEYPSWDATFTEGLGNHFKLIRTFMGLHSQPHQCRYNPLGPNRSCGHSGNVDGCIEQPIRNITQNIFLKLLATFLMNTDLAEFAIKLHRKMRETAP